MEQILPASLEEEDILPPQVIDDDTPDGKMTSPAPAPPPAYIAAPKPASESSDSWKKKIAPQPAPQKEGATMTTAHLRQAANSASASHKRRVEKTAETPEAPTPEGIQAKPTEQHPIVPKVNTRMQTILIHNDNEEPQAQRDIVLGGNNVIVTQKKAGKVVSIETEKPYDFSQPGEVQEFKSKMESIKTAEEIRDAISDVVHTAQNIEHIDDAQLLELIVGAFLRTYHANPRIIDKINESCVLFFLKARLSALQIQQVRKKVQRLRNEIGSTASVREYSRQLLKKWDSLAAKSTPNTKADGASAHPRVKRAVINEDDDDDESDDATNCDTDTTTTAAAAVAAKRKGDSAATASGNGGAGQEASADGKGSATLTSSGSNASERPSKRSKKSRSSQSSVNSTAAPRTEKATTSNRGENVDASQPRAGSSSTKAKPARDQKPSQASSVSKSSEAAKDDRAARVVDETTEHQSKREDKSRHDDRDRTRDKGREKEQERDKPKHHDREHGREGDRDRNREKDRERNRERSKEHNRERGRERDRSHDKERSRERERDRDRNRERDRDNERRDRDRSRDRERERSKDRDHERERNWGRGRDRDQASGSARPREWTRSATGDERLYGPRMGGQVPPGGYPNEFQFSGAPMAPDRAPGGWPVPFPGGPMAYPPGYPPYGDPAIMPGYLQNGITSQELQMQQQMQQQIQQAQQQQQQIQQQELQERYPKSYDFTENESLQKTDKDTELDANEEQDKKKTGKHVRFNTDVQIEYFEADGDPRLCKNACEKEAENERRTMIEARLRVWKDRSDEMDATIEWTPLPLLEVQPLVTEETRAINARNESRIPEMCKDLKFLKESPSNTERECVPAGPPATFVWDIGAPASAPLVAQSENLYGMLRRFAESDAALPTPAQELPLSMRPPLDMPLPSIPPLQGMPPLPGFPQMPPPGTPYRADAAAGVPQQFAFPPPPMGYSGFPPQDNPHDNRRFQEQYRDSIQQQQQQQQQQYQRYYQQPPTQQPSSGQGQGHFGRHHTPAPYCYFYYTKGCKNGSNCPFQHVPREQLPPDWVCPPPPAATKFQKFPHEQPYRN